LANGDRLPLADAGPRLDGERLHFRCPFLADGKEVDVPLAAVSVVWFAPTASDDPERLRRRLAAGPRKHDVVLLRNGDTLEGVLTALDGKTVELEVEKKPVKVEVGRTAAVALSTEWAEPPRPKGTFARVALSDPDGPADGARVTLASARCADGAVLTGETAFGAAFRAPLARVAALDLCGDRVAYLSDLQPLRYQFTPYLDDRWDCARDAAVTGLDLLLAGSTYDRGVGLHAGGRLTFAVPKGAGRFEATVGVDDRAGPRAAARVRVLADGKPLDLGGGDLTAAGGPVSVAADVAGAKELTLEVDYGPRGPVQGCVDWVDARFVK
jgi:hypothetical protein